MDRSFLSRAEVIAASRAFICIRLTTYENVKEMAYLKDLYVGRSGEVENSTFAILDPEGRRTLVRPARGPDHLFRDAAALAQRMNRIADDYKGKAQPPTLPLVSDLRLALNVASSDNLPLVVLLGDVKEESLAKLAWSADFRGRFVFARTAKVDDIEGVKIKEGILVVAPETFGRSGTVLAQGTVGEAESVWNAGLKMWKPAIKVFGPHIRDGKREGVFWETKTPVTDPMEARARKR